MMKKFKLSEYIEISKRGLDYAVYNSLKSGSLMILDNEALEFLQEFKKPMSICPNLDCEIAEISKQFIDSGLVVPENIDERENLRIEFEKHLNGLRKGNTLRGVTLEVTKKCNFRCTYCFVDYFSYKGKKGTSSDMSLHVAKKAIDFLINNAKINEHNSIEICFFGGEPLLNWSLIEYAVKYANYHTNGSEMEVLYSIITNGSLVNQKIASFLKENRVKVSVSLDGPQYLNDKTRKYADGKGTFNETVKGINTLISAGNEITVLTTLSNKNIDLLNFNFVDFLISLGVRNWGLNLEDVKSMLNSEIKDIAQKLVTLSNYALKRKLNTAGMWFKPIYNMMNVKKSYCMSGEGAFVSIGLDGKIYSCSRTVNSIGHVDKFDDIFKNNDYIKFGSNIIGGIPECVGCELEGMCLGGCYAINELNKNESNRCGLTCRSEKSCDFIKKIVKSILEDEESLMIE